MLQMPRSSRILQTEQPNAAPEPSTRTAPVLMVDIDGVISLFGFDAQTQPAGAFHWIDGIPHYLSAGAAGHLLRLADTFELVWCSGWEERADEYLPYLLGMPRGLPFLSFERSVGRSNAHWKLDAIDAYAGVRPLAWIDDAFNPACHAWAHGRGHPTLLVRTDPEVGLTQRETQQLAAWAQKLQMG
jgi:HAD domain in Swiss Army Knife RNA repair proteins